MNQPLNILEYLTPAELEPNTNIKLTQQVKVCFKDNAIIGKEVPSVNTIRLITKKIKSLISLAGTS